MLWCYSVIVLVLFYSSSVTTLFCSGLRWIWRPVPGTVEMMQKYTLDEMPVHLQGPMHTHSHTVIHTWGPFSITSPPVFSKQLIHLQIPQCVNIKEKEIWKEIWKCIAFLTPQSSNSSISQTFCLGVKYSRITLPTRALFNPLIQQDVNTAKAIVKMRTLS